MGALNTENDSHKTQHIAGYKVKVRSPAVQSPLGPFGTLVANMDRRNETISAADVDGRRAQSQLLLVASELRRRIPLRVPDLRSVQWFIEILQ